MSIKSLFENIADAIKDKNPNVTNVTPVEMPSAIRDIPSGSSTAGGVTYDNTTSRLTANNVQDAIDELAEDISTINSDLSELDASPQSFSFLYLGNGSSTAFNVPFHPNHLRLLRMSDHEIFQVSQLPTTGIALTKVNDHNYEIQITSGSYNSKGTKYLAVAYNRVFG